MGCQGEIYVIYGLEVEGVVEKEFAFENNPVLYSVNGITISDCDKYCGVSEEYIGQYRTLIYDKSYYPEKDRPAPEDMKLSIRVRGHDSSGLNMGARHAVSFKEEKRSNVGESCKVLLGFSLGNESYLNNYSKTLISPETGCQKYKAALVKKLEEQFNLIEGRDQDYTTEDFGIYLLFDSRNGF